MLLLPCRDKQCLNEQEHVQSMVPFWFFCWLGSFICLGFFGN